MAKAAYIGVPTVSSPLGSMTEGSIVQINENGTPADFYVAKHDYESGLNGAGRTLLVRKGKYEYRKWHSSNVNAYATSDIDAWLNGDYKALLSPAIQNAIGTTSFPYTVGNGNYTITNLSRSVFLISAYEVNVVSAGYFNSEGSVLPIASEIINSSDAFWTRTCYTKSAADAIYIDRSVSALHGGTTCSSTMGAVPCFTLPSDIGVFDGLITGASAGTVDTAHKINKLYLGIDSVSHKIKKAYIGVAGVARLFFSDGYALANLPEGTLVQINENGNPVKFYVAKHDYESGLNGAGRTLMVRSTSYGSMGWDTNKRNTYANSTIDTWCNNTYKSMLDTTVQELIGTTSFYYTPGGGNATVTSLARSVFVLSAREFGVSGGSSSAVHTGSTLPIAATIRSSVGSGNYEWTRTQSSPGGTGRNIICVYGGSATQVVGNEVSMVRGRPVFTLPSDGATVNPEPNADGSYTLLV